MGDASSAAPDRRPRLGVDVGRVRVGVAGSDPDGTLAFPVATVARTTSAESDVAAIVRERAAGTVYVGLPRSLDGSEGSSAADARAFAGRLAELVDVPVRLIDERLSTVSAEAALRAAGRDSRRQRGVIDQAAAVVILDNALDTEKRGMRDQATELVAREES